MIKIIKQSLDYMVIQDDSQINQYCVMVRTNFGFKQQISPWYFRKGNAIRKYRQILQKKTNEILNRDELQ